MCYGIFLKEIKQHFKIFKNIHDFMMIHNIFLKNLQAMKQGFSLYTALKVVTSDE